MKLTSDLIRHGPATILDTCSKERADAARQYFGANGLAAAHSAQNGLPNPKGDEMIPDGNASALERPVSGHWADGELPRNIRLGNDTICTGEFAFKRFYSELQPALTIGNNCTMDDVHFALGKRARIEIGNYCFFSSTLLLCELEIQVGNHVVIGWNVTIADTDFHPLDPSERIVDAVACSPRGKGLPRPEVTRRPVRIGNDVWIGPGATILKGVTIGDGAFVEPGTVVLRDVSPGSHVIGNPAEIVQP